MSQSITINLSDELYTLLRRAAELAEQPVEVIVAQSLAHSLPPLLEDIPPAYQLEVYPLLAMTDEALRQELSRTFPSDRWTEYETLLGQKKSRVLTEQETDRLQELRHEADILSLRKSYSAVLLKRRGRQIPALNELTNPS